MNNDDGEDRWTARKALERSRHLQEAAEECHREERERGTVGKKEERGECRVSTQLIVIAIYCNIFIAITYCVYCHYCNKYCSMITILLSLLSFL